MNKKEQTQFVCSICKGIADDILHDIASGRIPPVWDGHELRVLIAERAEAAASISEISRHATRGRALAYRNTVTINQL